MTPRKIRFPKPGETLLLDLLAPLGLSPQQMAERTSLPVDQIEGIIDGTQPITPEIAAKLSAFSDTTATFWMNLQKAYENAQV
jgi:addiction module antidote protein, HigA family